MTIDINRRALIAGAGALTVSVALPGVSLAAGSAGLSARPPLRPDQLATFVSINADGGAVAYFGKMDTGQGTDVGVLQIVAEELDLSPDRVSVIMGDTAETVNQGGASGSTGIQKGGMALRHAAAEARRVLVGMAADKLGVPAESLTVDNGVVSAKTNPDQKVSYGDLIGGRFFDVHLQWNGKIGNDLAVTGEAKPKNPSEYKVVGKPVRRRDVEGRVMGTAEFVVDVKAPGMVHGRMVRPPVAGATPVSIDEESIRSIPGAQLVHIQGFVGVVAPREWDAIQAARKLKIVWSDSKPDFPTSDGVHEAIRKAPVVKRGVELDQGDLAGAFAKAAKIVEATYEWPFQSHASMGPACAVVDYKPDGGTTVWTGSQKPHYARDGAANMLGLKPEQVHGVWVPGPGSYGRNDAGDALADAAVLSKAVGKPVRVQYMRNEGTGWDPKGPASVHTVRAAIDQNGEVIGWDFESKGFSRLDVESNESHPRDTLAGQLMGVALKPTPVFNVPEESYGFPAKRKGWTTIPALLDRASPLRTSHMRDPLGPQLHFANESFIDELAYALQTDPVDFRLKYLRDPRDLAVVKAAAEKAGWRKRTAPGRQTKDGVALGQGVSYAQRGGTRVAIVANVEVNLQTGRVWARRYAIAHDCGQIINPELLHLGIEGNLVQATSRSLLEEVKFDDKNVTSVDWLTYPILDIEGRSGND